MLGLTGAGVVGTGIALAGCSQQSAQTTENTSTDGEASAKVTLTMYDPTGGVEITAQFSPRLDTLEGKTLAFVSDDAWEDDRTFPLIQSKLESMFTNITIYTADNFPSGIAAITKNNNGIAEMMQERGVDGVIVGNAG